MHHPTLSRVISMRLSYAFPLPITRRQILDSSKLKEFADDNFKFDEDLQKVIQTGRKHWEKEKLFVTSNFSFSHSIFKRPVSQGRQKVSLCGNGLISCNRASPIKPEGLLLTLSKTRSFRLFQTEKVSRQQF